MTLAPELLTFILGCALGSTVSLFAVRAFFLWHNRESGFVIDGRAWWRTWKTAKAEVNDQGEGIVRFYDRRN